MHSVRIWTLCQFLNGNRICIELLTFESKCVSLMFVIESLDKPKKNILWYLSYFEKLSCFTQKGLIEFNGILLKCFWAISSLPRSKLWCTFYFIPCLAVDVDKKLNVKILLKKKWPIAPGVHREMNCVAQPMSVTGSIELLAACQWCHPFTDRRR